jgi:hypothetical protein
VRAHHVVNTQPKRQLYTDSHPHRDADSHRVHRGQANLLVAEPASIPHASTSPRTHLDDRRGHTYSHAYSDDDAGRVKTALGFYDRALHWYVAHMTSEPPGEQTDDLTGYMRPTSPPPPPPRVRAVDDTVRFAPIMAVPPQHVPYTYPTSTSARKHHVVRNVLASLFVGFALCVGGVVMLHGDDSATLAVQATTPPASKPVTRVTRTSVKHSSEMLAVANATESARGYLAGQPFSRYGLIQQLSSPAGDGYEMKIAVAAVDSLHVDWNAQATRSALEYLKFDHFSRNGLIAQLESKYGAGFTHAQAVYGVDHAGL